MKIDAALLNSSDPLIQDTAKYIRQCVHCGFCNATCPTYQLEADELEGPRGRIYLIKNMLETSSASKITKTHLDQCLHCLSCHSTCPAGVEYQPIIEAGQMLAQRYTPLSFKAKLTRIMLHNLLIYPIFLRHFMDIARFFKPLLPRSLKRRIPANPDEATWPTIHSENKIILAVGCAQAALKPNTNKHIAHLLAQFGYEALIDQHLPSCCGALGYHNHQKRESINIMRSNIDRWHLLLTEKKANAILYASSACSFSVKQYPRYFQYDKQYRDKAIYIGKHVFELGEFISKQDLSKLSLNKKWISHNNPIAFHPPCTLQHGHKLAHEIQSILRNLGFELTQIDNEHLCCGSAGTYSLFHSEKAESLLKDKIKNIMAHNPKYITSANIGCECFIEGAADTQTLHWASLIYKAMVLK